MVLYMSLDKFLLAVESRDLSQAYKEYCKSVFFPKAEGQFLLRFWNVLVLVIVLTFASILID